MNTNIKKIFFLLICLFTSMVFLDVKVYCTTNKKIKTSIDEIMDSKQVLFLKGEKPQINAKGVLLMNNKTGQVLYSLNANEPMPIYSVSKLLSVYVILDRLKTENDLNLNTKITCNKKIARLSTEQNFTNLEMFEGTEYSISELLEATLIKSSNSAVMLLGEHIFGSEFDFVKKLQEKASSLNLKHTSIVSSTGLNKADLEPYGYIIDNNVENSMTTAEAAYLSNRLLDDHPEILDITVKEKACFGQYATKKVEYTTSNYLLPGMPEGYQGITGLKTGADLKEGSSCIVFTATRADKEIIGVIIGAKNAKSRSKIAHKLLDYAFDTIKEEVVLSKDYKLFGTNELRTQYSLKNKIKIKLKEDFILSYSTDSIKPQFYFLPTNNKYDVNTNKIKGSIKKGEVIGKIVTTFSDLYFITGDNIDFYGVEVVSEEDSKESFLLLKVLEDITSSIERIKLI